MPIKRTTREKASYCYTLAFNLKEALKELNEMVTEDFQDGNYPMLDEKATCSSLWVLRNTATELFYDIGDMGDKLK